MQSIYSYDNLMNEWLGWRSIIYDNLRTAFRTLLSVYGEYNTWSEESMNLAGEVLVSDNFAVNINPKIILLTKQAIGDINATDHRLRTTRFSSS